MKNNLKKLQKLIWIDILIFIIVYIIGVVALEFFNISPSNPLYWLLLGLPLVILIFSLFNKLKQIPYICKNCGGTIYIKFKQMFSLHAGTQRRLKCPHCDRVTWAEIKDNNL